MRMNALNLFIINAIILSGRCWEHEDCVSVTGDVTFNITYEKDNGQQDPTSAVYTVSIPKDSATVTGACENTTTKQSSISIAWGGFKAEFVFIKKEENDHWYADMSQLSYSASSIPDAHNPKDSTVRTTGDQQLFLTRLTHFYQCNSSDTHPLYHVDEDGKVNQTSESTHMTTLNLVVRPFKLLTESEVCSKDNPPEPTDPPQPHNPTDGPKPTQPPVNPGPSGGRVAWTCTVVTLLVLCVCAIFIYHNRDGVPPYVRVV